MQLPEIPPEQLKILKSLSPATKLKLADELYQTAKALKMSVLRERYPHWSEEKIAKKGESFDINLSELGYTKLLAQGSIDASMNITVKYASERAINKVKDAGGKVKLLE